MRCLARFVRAFFRPLLLRKSKAGTCWRTESEAAAGRVCASIFALAVGKKWWLGALMGALSGESIHDPEGNRPAVGPCGRNPPCGFARWPTGRGFEAYARLEAALRLSLRVVGARFARPGWTPGSPPLRARARTLAFVAAPASRATRFGNP